MKQKEIIAYYENNGGLRCSDWTLKEIKDCIKSDFGADQRVYKSTCYLLKRMAELYQK